MKTKLTSLLLACSAVAASPITSRAQDSRPSQETIKPAEPTAKPRPDGDRKPDGERNRDGDHKRDGRDSDHKNEGDRAKHDGDKREGENRGEHREHGDNRSEHREHAKAPDAKPVPFLGLALHGLSTELTAQVGLPEGFGLVVGNVMDGSPAKEAGFQKYDVLILIGDQRIVNYDQFQALIRSQKKGDEVTLTIKRIGAELKVSAKLGEHVFPAVAEEHPHPMMPPHARGQGPGPMSNHRFGDPKERMGEIKERMEHMRGMMRERFQNRGDGPRGPDVNRGPNANRGPQGGGNSRPMPFGSPMAGHGPMNPMNGPQGQPNHNGPNDHGPNASGPHNPGPQGQPNHNGPNDHGPNPNGPRADGPHNVGPRPQSEQHHEGVRPGNPQGDRGPRADGPHQDGPRPDAQPHRDGARPDNNRGDHSPQADGPSGNGPRPDGQPGAPKPRE